MTKTELVEELARDMDISSRTASKCVSFIFEVITEELSKGGDVTIPGFGKFYATEVGERQVFGHTTPAHMAPKFKAGKALKDALT